MKTLKPILIILVIIVVIIGIFSVLGRSQQMVVVSENNTQHDPIEMVVGKFQCSECGMLINDLDHASQIVAPDGKTWFYDDHGCMAAWLKDKPFEKSAIIWVKDLPSREWINGRLAWYSRTDETPMMYGFGAYRDKQGAFITFTEMQQAMLKGETMANLRFRKELMGK